MMMLRTRDFKEPLARVLRIYKKPEGFTMKQRTIIFMAIIVLLAVSASATEHPSIIKVEFDTQGPNMMMIHEVVQQHITTWTHETDDCYSVKIRTGTQEFSPHVIFTVVKALGKAAIKGASNIIGQLL